MAIVRMSKFNLFCFDDDRDKLLKTLQKFKYVHFINLKDESLELKEINRADEIIKIDEKINKTRWAIDLLNKYVEKKKALQSLKDGQKDFTLEDLKNHADNFSFNKRYEFFKNLSDKKDKLLQENLNINSQVDELSPWKQIEDSINDLKNVKNANIITGAIPSRYIADFNEKLKDYEYLHAQKLHQDKNFTYYVLISKEDDLTELFRQTGFNTVSIKTDKVVKDEISRLESILAKNREEIKKINDIFLAHNGEQEDFLIYYEYLRNERLRIASVENFVSTDRVNLIEGYVPTNKVKNLEENIENVLGKDFYIKFEDAKKDDPNVPIMLENNKFVSAFEMLTSMYSMPRYNEIDPTPFFAPFYFIFAGIMVGDFGYGLIVFLMTLFAIKKFKLSKEKKKFLVFFNYLSISTMIWGLIFGSIFGGAIEMPALIDPSTDYLQMILMSLVLGGIHLFFGLGIKAYMNVRDKKPKDALYDVGFWYMALIGIIVLIVNKSGAITLNPILLKVFLIVMLIGMIGIVATGGRAEKSTGGKIGWGIYALYGITSYLGDAVSYLRLMALALAGSFIGVAINLICSMLLGSNIVAKLVAVLIFLVFQSFNAFLSYLSAYVHSARLTYVEMFNKFYEGGGVPFKKLVEKSNYFNIEED